MTALVNYIVLIAVVGTFSVVNSQRESDPRTINPFPFLKKGNWQNDAVFQTILDKLLKDYDSRIRPNVTSAKAATIRNKIFVDGISSVDELHFDFKMKFDLTQQWRDPRLAFNLLTSSANNTFIVVRNEFIDKVWTPDTYFVNEKINFDSAPSGLKRNVQMRIYATGDVVYVMRLNLKFSCQMNLQKYPHDRQQCHIRMGSFAYAREHVEFRWATTSAFKVTSNLNQPKFVLTKSTTDNCMINTHGEEYTCIEGNLFLERAFSFHLMSTFFPTILLVISSWMSFWIDPAAVPARVAIGVTTLLTIVAMLVAVRVSLPPVSYVKAIDVWMFMCILYIFGALVEFAAMNSAQVRFKQKKGLMPELSSCCGQKEETPVELITHTTSPPQSTITIKTESEKSGGDGDPRMSAPHPPPSIVSLPPKDPPAPPHMPTHMNIDNLSRYFFPISFSFFVIIYWSYYSI